MGEGRRIVAALAVMIAGAMALAWGTGARDPSSAAYFASVLPPLYDAQEVLALSIQDAVFTTRSGGSPRLDGAAATVEALPATVAAVQVPPELAGHHARTLAALDAFATHIRADDDEAAFQAALEVRRDLGTIITLLRVAQGQTG